MNWRAVIHPATDSHHFMVITRVRCSQPCSRLSKYLTSTTADTQHLSCRPREGCLVLCFASQVGSLAGRSLLTILIRVRSMKIFECCVLYGPQVQNGLFGVLPAPPKVLLSYSVYGMIVSSVWRSGSCPGVFCSWSFLQLTA